MLAIVAKANPMKLDFFTLGNFLSPKESKVLVEALKRGGLLGTDGIINRDPRRYANEYANAAREALPEVYKRRARWSGSRSVSNHGAPQHGVLHARDNNRRAGRDI